MVQDRAIVVIAD